MAKKITTNETPVEAAERVLGELQAQHDKVTKARESDDRELGAVSYSALAAGDKDAVQRLEAVKERSLRRDLELKAIQSAIAQAQQHLAEAKANEAAADQRRVALELRELATVMRASAKKCDAGLAMLTEGAKEMRDAIAKTNARGLGNPSATQLQSLGERAVLTALLEMPWARAFQHLAPAQRQTFVGFATQWAFAIERAVDAKLKQLGGGEKAA
jgi:hypothetical protein